MLQNAPTQVCKRCTTQFTKIAGIAYQNSVQKIGWLLPHKGANNGKSLDRLVYDYVQQPSTYRSVRNNQPCFGYTERHPMNIYSSPIPIEGRVNDGFLCLKNILSRDLHELHDRSNIGSFSVNRRWNRLHRIVKVLVLLPYYWTNYLGR